MLQVSQILKRHPTVWNHQNKFTKDIWNFYIKNWYWSICRCQKLKLNIETYY